MAEAKKRKVHSAEFKGKVGLEAVRFAMSPDAAWSGNFRDLSASVTRMVTLADAGGIGQAIVAGETTRLQQLWRHHNRPADNTDVDLAEVLGNEAASQLDMFDAVQLAAVVRVCRQSKSISDAGRKLYNVSREAKAKPNDADRLKKYLARFGLAWGELA